VRDNSQELAFGDELSPEQNF